MKMKYDEIGQADNPGGMGELPGVPVQPTDKLAAVDKAINQKVEAMNGKYPWKNGSPVVNVPAAGATGYSTSEGVPIESSFRYADDFYNQMGINNILDNTPSGAMSYQGYLAYNGITDPRTNYVMALDRANEMYARSLGTYGASGESLAQGNLVGTGYSEYLNGLAYQNKANMYIAAQQQLSADQRQTAAQYQQYLRDYEKENGISVPGAALGDETGGVSVEGTSTVLTPSQQQAYDYLSGNVTVSADIPAAVIAMRSQGLSGADIEAALNNWNALRTENINREIDKLSSLESGNAAKLKEAYGEGEDYEAALGRLHKQNSRMVDKAVRAIEEINFDDEANEVLKILRESTAKEGKNGEISYEWDSMSDGDKAVAVRDYIKELYNSGDISKETYNDAMYRYFSKKIDNEIEKHKSWIGGANNQIKAVAEQLAKIEAEDGMLSDEQKKALYTDLKKRIKLESDGSNGIKISIDGNNKSYRFSTTPGGTIGQSEWAAFHNNTDEKYRVNLPDDIASGERTGLFKTDWTDKDGVETWFYSDGEHFYAINAMGGFTKPQTNALLNLLYGN